MSKEINALSVHRQNLFHEEVNSLKTVDYLSYHKHRFKYLLQKCRSVCPDRNGKVLDVGRSTFSVDLLSNYDCVYTLGFELSGIDDFGPESWAGLGSSNGFAGHVVYNLNDAQHDTLPACEVRFDLIVCAEVIEHLYTAPELSMYALSQMLCPGGSLIIQTPNAVALHKRVLMAFGVNPFEKLRVNQENPGHFREYTKKELVALAERIGLEYVNHEFKDYFGNGGKSNALIFSIYRLIVKIFPSFARGQTIVLRKPF